ncbi:carbohydrate kinase family protein [Chryseobacterium salviniae]|uniref:Carbohydrate kinase n=1 Tax=Chryseobacterium salviniae TaxID=3101750 RepID=A0ABU6HUK0_9FLAO|nr:carbohydrate kinase [Chryseobacterium sp. T9W2-O]MEC3876359.1 carbohydrate kinase [Chryseobacterium sp. T9W2-O]
MKYKQPYIVCFGEVLWDIFPEGSRAGGAPFNVAYNFHKAGIDVKVISKTGNDDLGEKLRKQIENWGISTEMIQIDKQHPTSTVIAKIDDCNEATYEITNNVAWDYIENIPEYNQLVANAEAFVFGSLSSRNEKTRKTLLKLLDTAKLKIFDVNFRPPFIDTEVIKTLFHKSDIVKINASELRQVIQLTGIEYSTEEQAVKAIQKNFAVKEVILTKGSEGATYFVDEQSYTLPAVPVTVADTVGSGDAFLSGFISKRIFNESPEEILKNAVSLGAFITSKSGACPDYHYSEFEEFKRKHF